MILFIGSYGTGITMRVDRVPSRGETLSGATLSMGHGGKSSNQAVAARRYGANCSIVTAIGNDSFGHEAQALWERESVDYSHVKQSQDTATMAGVILVEPSGDNRIVIAPGALDEITVADIEERTSVFDSCRLVVICLEIPAQVAECAITMAKQRNIPVVLNPAPAAKLRKSILDQVDFFIPNETEYDFYREQGYCRPANQTLIITQGAQGARIESENDATHVPPYPQQDVIDTTGAGDTFVGVFAAAVHEGKDVLEATQEAIVASSLSVTAAEVIPSIPKRDQINTHLSRYKQGNNDGN